MFGGSYEKSSGEYETIPEGRYAVMLENATIERTKSGTDFLQLVFVITGGDFDKRKLWHKLWMTEKAYNMTSQQLDNIYVFKKIPPQASIEGFMNVAADMVFALVDKRFEIEVQGHDEYNGKMYPKTFLTGYMDSPNFAVQVFENQPQQSAQTQKTSAGPTPARQMAQPPSIDENEAIPF